MSKKNHEKLAIEIGKRLEELREEWALDRYKMSLRTGVAESTYYKYEKGLIFPGYSVMLKLLKDFNISINWLFFGQGPKHFISENELEQMTSEVSEPLQERITQLEKELSTVRTESEQEISGLKQQVEQLNARLETLTETKETLESELAETKETMETELAETRAALDKIPPVSDDARELLIEMNRDSVLRYEILLKFQRHKQETKESGK